MIKLKSQDVKSMLLWWRERIIFKKFSDYCASC